VSARRPRLPLRRARGILRVVAVLALGGLGVVAAPSAPAEAAPSVWTRAREPGFEQRRALLAEAEALLIRYDRLLRSPLADSVRQVGPLWLRQARALYEQAGAPTARDPFLRLRYAGLLEDLADYPAATRAFEALLRTDPPLPVQADAWRELAVCYARLGRHQDEIKAYAEALALEPHSGPRAILHANRAEAYMALGDIISAIAGYRAALSGLSTREMFRYGVTTLWGLGVALDRSGDLEGALEHITLARSYDRTDQQLNGPGWFYVPAHDEAWYTALGHWQAARTAELGAARAEAYNQAVAAWEDYLARAPGEDQWAPLARARLAQCEKERDDARRRALSVRSAPAPAPSPPRPRTPGARTAAP